MGIVARDAWRVASGVAWLSAMLLIAGCAQIAAYAPRPGVLFYAREGQPPEGGFALDGDEDVQPQEETPSEGEDEPEGGDELGDVLQEGVTRKEAEDAPEAQPPEGVVGDIGDDGQVEFSGEAVRGWPDFYFARGPRFVALVLDALNQETGDTDAQFGVGGSTGIGLRFGWSLYHRGTLTFAAEAAFSQGSLSTSNPGGGASIQRIAVGVRVQGRADEKFQKYLSTGFSQNTIDFDGVSYKVDGVGLYFGGGVDYFLNNRFSLGLDGRIHLWTGEDDFAGEGNEQSLTVSAGVQLHF